MSSSVAYYSLRSNWLSFINMYAYYIAAYLFLLNNELIDWLIDTFIFFNVSAVIYSICEDFQLDFYAMYGCVGLWSAFFLVLYSLFDVSRLMRWSTRSTEEIFALFISIAFCVDAFRDTVKSNCLTHGLHTHLFLCCVSASFCSLLGVAIVVLAVATSRVRSL